MAGSDRFFKEKYYLYADNNFFQHWGGNMRELSLRRVHIRLDEALSW